MIPSEVWGSSAWFFLHAVTFGYPDKPTKKDKHAMAQLFHILGFCLPCHQCQQHWRQNLKKYPIEPHLHSRDSLTRWLVDMHNRVNEQTGKPPFPVEQVNEKFNNLRDCDCAAGGFTSHNGSCVNTDLLQAWLICGILLLVIAGLLYYILVFRKM